MSTQRETPAIELVIENFTNAVKQSAYSQIKALYTEDGIFMPQGFNSVESRQIGKRGLKGLLITDFKINIEKIDIDGLYAFVTARAEVRSGESDEVKTSRDFFVLRKGNDQWKIYRYIFNTLPTAEKSDL